MQPEQISSSTQLLVEGNDGRNFFDALCRHLDATEVQIQNFGGIDELAGFLRAFVRSPGFNTVERLGIVRDAETSASAAFQSVRSSLQNAELPVPSHPGALSAGVPTVGALILPEQGAGMLETVLARSFAGTPVDACIDAFLTCAEAGGATMTNPDKSRAFTYLAATPRPHVSVGVAAQRGLWDFDHEAFYSIRSFLRELAR